MTETRRKCPDRRLAQCLCATCAKVCSCLRDEYAALPCPVNSCRDYRLVVQPTAAPQVQQLKMPGGV